MKIILLGFRGAGKTTVAQLVAPTLKIPVIDLDERLEIRAQMPLPDFMEKNGEKKFRDWEAEELEKALAEPRAALIVTGGGIVDGERSHEILRTTHDVKLLLHCTPEVLWERLKTNPERLRIGKLENFSDLKRLWEQRAAKFRALTTFSVDASDLNCAAEEVSSLLSRVLS